jgi:hypothetical protein
VTRKAFIAALDYVQARLSIARSELERGDDAAANEEIRKAAERITETLDNGDERRVA